MLPEVVNQLSKTRCSKFDSSPLYNNALCWEKAQKVQEHIVVSEEDLYLFGSYHYFATGAKEITKKIFVDHIEAFKLSNFQDFKEKRILYVYNKLLETCECVDFWKFGYCKHLLAVKIYLEQIQVNSLNVSYIIKTKRYQSNFQLRKYLCSNQNLLRKRSPVL